MQQAPDFMSNTEIQPGNRSGDSPPVEAFRIGSSPKRLEDHRLVRGKGQYFDDLSDLETLYAAVVRSNYAHGAIVGIDSSAAGSRPGVVAILTGRDQAAAGILPVWPHARVNDHNGEEFGYEPQPVLAIDRVRYVGEPVALVVARTRAEAENGAALVDVEVCELPAVVDGKAALEPGAPEISERVARNACLDWQFGSQADVDAAFDQASYITELQTHNHRIVISPMEPRGARGSYDSETHTYELLLSSQNVHVIREHVARSLNVDPEAVRVRAPDVGGGFGVRNFAYGEYVLVLWAARELGRPVKWVNTRSEGFISDHQARDYYASAQLALDASGRFLGLRADSVFNAGAYLVGAGGRVPTFQYTTLPGGAYDIPAIHLKMAIALTNTAPIGVTRGPGFAEAVGVIERLIDKAASDHGFDRIALRRVNLANKMPWRNAVGNTVDSGNFLNCLDVASQAADLRGFDERRQHSQSQGQLRGLGLAMHIKATGGAPDENIDLTFHHDGVILTTGTQAIGQGHETSFRQIVGGLLGLPASSIEYRAGDTSLIPMGGGHGSSRATYMAGTAISMAVDKVLAKGRRVAANALEAGVEDIEFADGAFTVAGTDRTLTLLEAARRARELGDPLDTYQYFVRDAMTYPNGCHVAEVEIDPETGKLVLERYTCADDYGVLVNPMIAEGQMHGAIAQGVGQAMMEHAVYAPDSGQPVTGSFMDYCLPRADDLPAFNINLAPTSCTTNPLGVKGCGEAGAIAGYPAVANAVLDALKPLGVTNFSGPATPFNLWRLIQNGR